LGASPLSRTVEVQIDVVDRSNKPPVWDQVVYGPIYVKENTAIGETVTTVKARSASSFVFIVARVRVHVVLSDRERTPPPLFLPHQDPRLAPNFAPSLLRLLLLLNPTRVALALFFLEAHFFPRRPFIPCPPPYLQ